LRLRPYSTEQVKEEAAPELTENEKKLTQDIEKLTKDVEALTEKSKELDVMQLNYHEIVF
jgi:peptidoglycan hydrolase CwlO-like protein